MSTYLVTGAGRGIGLELTRQLAQLGESRVARVFAVGRGEPSTDLAKLIAASPGRVEHVSCEVTKPESVDKAAAEVRSRLGGSGLDVLVNNVGMMPFHPDGMRTVDADSLAAAFSTNVISTQLVSAAFVPLLEEGRAKQIFNISTSVGSITYAARYTGAPTPAYKITKAALNMLTVQYALEYGPKGFTVVAVTPGWLKTDMGSAYADLEVQQGVQAVVELMLKAGPDMNGKFQNIHVAGWEHASGPNQYDGTEIPCAEGGIWLRCKDPSPTTIN